MYISIQDFEKLNISRQTIETSSKYIIYWLDTKVFFGLIACCEKEDSYIDLLSFIAAYPHGSFIKTLESFPDHRNLKLELYQNSAIAKKFRNSRETSLLNLLFTYLHPRHYETLVFNQHLFKKNRFY